VIRQKFRSTGRPRLNLTANVLGLTAVLAAMWYAASSQNNAPAYLLLFTLASLALVSLLHTFNNLSGLTVQVDSPPPAFAGQEIPVPVEILNTSGRTRYGIAAELSCGEVEPETLDRIEAGKAERLTLHLPATQRGRHELGSVSLTTRYPLGFFAAAMKIKTSQNYLVYPRPAGDPGLPPAWSRSRPASAHIKPTEADEFAGSRAYIPGESQRHIDWKAVARGQPLMTKQFAADQGGTLYLDFDRIPAPGVEPRLSQLALWIIEAQRSGRAYGLRMPGLDIPPGLGDSHFHRCLRQLALFE
jgi:uncharacterized protein (DUF58 family)